MATLFRETNAYVAAWLHGAPRSFMILRPQRLAFYADTAPASPPRARVHGSSDRLPPIWTDA